MNIIPNNTNENLTEAQTRQLEALDRAMFITPLVPAPAQLAARIMSAARLAHAQRKPQPAISAAQLAFLLAVSAVLLVMAVLLFFSPFAFKAALNWFNPLAALGAVGQDLVVMFRAASAIGRAILSKPYGWMLLMTLVLLTKISFAGVLGAAVVPSLKKTSDR
jgi:hypothetical protein